MGSIPTRSRHAILSALRRAALLIALVAVPISGEAQQVDSIRAGLKPPISPRRAFLYSLVLPGAGQAKLDRSYTGGMFFLIEVATIVYVHRSAEDLRIARRFAGDSMPLSYQTDPVTGVVQRDANNAPIVAQWSVPRYDADWVRTRRLHYEDWLAVLFFNHLFAGADAFVAAQLWDLPTKVRVQQTSTGPALSATISFR